MIRITVLALLAWFCVPAPAMLPPTASDLQQWCVAPGDGHDEECARYLQGFIDGAVTTDPRVAESVADELSRDEETFAERAFRTRLRRNLDEIGPSVYAGFCVDLPVQVSDVAEHVRTELSMRASLAGVSAASIVYASLRRNYPCEAAPNSNS